LDGLAGFLTELFIKRYLGNNEARYRRFKVRLLPKACVILIPVIA
jgi:hypothetical protein